jgi:DNA-binding response OmpR family regulator
MMRVLIVEDEEHLADLLAEVLAREGHVAEAAPCGRTASRAPCPRASTC